jgi:hypothetical protein
VLKLLANENFPGDAVDALRARGHDVTWIRTEAPGVAAFAVRALESRTDWAGHFSVIEETRVRMTPLP